MSVLAGGYRRDERPTDGLNVLVVGGLPIVRAGIAYLVHSEFGHGVRVFSADWEAGERAFAVGGAHLDLLVANHPGAETTPDPCLRLVSSANGSGVVVVLPPKLQPRPELLRAGVVAIALEAPLNTWRDALQAAAAKPRIRFGPRRARVQQVPSQLTERQREVLEMVSMGFSNKSIANRLSLSVGTVKLHVAAVLHALHARNRVDLLARREALSTPRVSNDRLE